MSLGDNFEQWRARTVSETGKNTARRADATSSTYFYGLCGNLGVCLGPCATAACAKADQWHWHRAVRNKSGGRFPRQGSARPISAGQARRPSGHRDRAPRRHQRFAPERLGLRRRARDALLLHTGKRRAIDSRIPGCSHPRPLPVPPPNIIVTSSSSEGQPSSLCAAASCQKD